MIGKYRLPVIEQESYRNEKQSIRNIVSDTAIAKYGNSSYICGDYSMMYKLVDHYGVHFKLM